MKAGEVLSSGSVAQSSADGPLRSQDHRVPSVWWFWGKKRGERGSRGGCWRPTEPFFLCTPGQPAGQGSERRPRGRAGHTEGTKGTQDGDRGETRDGHGASGRNLPSPERRSGAAAERRLRGAPVAGAAGSGRAAWGRSGARGSAAACSGARGAVGPPHG